MIAKIGSAHKPDSPRGSIVVATQMLEIADLFCFDRTSTPYIFYSGSFYHLPLRLGPRKARLLKYLLSQAKKSLEP